MSVITSGKPIIRRLLLEATADWRVSESRQEAKVMPQRSSGMPRGNFPTERRSDQGETIGAERLGPQRNPQNILRTLVPIYLGQAVSRK